MMSTKRLCILIIVICIITPLGVGFMMPQSTEQVIEYSTGPTSIISSSIRNNVSDYTTDYFGDTNNSLWGLYPGISGYVYWEPTSNKNSTPEIVSTTQVMGTSAWDYNYIDSSMAYFSGPGYRMSYGAQDGSNRIILKITAPDGTETVRTGIYMATFVPAAKAINADGDLIYLDAGYKCRITTADQSKTTYTLYQNSTTSWRDIGLGVGLIEGYGHTYWQNGYANYNVIATISLEPDCSFIYAGVTIERSSAGLVTLTYNSTVLEIGNYGQIMIELSEDGLIAHGLSSGSISSNPWARVVNTRTLEEDLGLQWPIRGIEVEAIDTQTVNYDFKSLIYIYSAEVVIGQYESTIDKTINMNDYYPQMDGFAMKLSNGSTVTEGAELVICGVSFPVQKGGIITYNGINYSLTGMVISVVNDDGTQYVNLNNVAVTDTDMSDWNLVDLQGDWGSIGVSISEVSGNVREIFHWESGLFALSLQTYAGIGLAAAVGAFILCAMIGRRSGEKVFWLMVVSGCCAAFYAVLLLGS